MKNIALPLIGKLEKVIINNMSFEYHADGSRKLEQPEVKYNTSYSMGIDEEEYKRYFVSVELTMEGIDTSSGEKHFNSKCKMTGFFSAKEPFDEFKDQIVDIARVRGMYQIFPMVRMEVQAYLRKSGVHIENFIFEQDEILESENIFCATLVESTSKNK